MTWLQIVVLALVQGVTEFLPISSSGHLALVPYLADWPDQGVQMDVAVHVGSLGAVIIYFWRDVLGLINGGFALLAGKMSEPRARLVWFLVVATIPAVIAGAVIAKLAPDLFRNVTVIAWTMLLGGILLYVADRYGKTTNVVEDLTLRHALLIGLAQALALIPGTSRAGITVTAGRFLGYTRPEAARFSMLMSIPIIIAAGTLGAFDIAKSEHPLMVEAVLVAIVLSFISALAAIAILMRWLQHASFTPLVIYRIGLGLLLIAIVYA